MPDPENALPASAKPPRRLYTEITIHPATALYDLLLSIMAERRTGSLTINFAGGKPDGTAEWKQRFEPLALERD